MAFTDITSITAPSSAGAGERVDITVKIKNLYSAALGIKVGGTLEYGITPWPTITYPTDWANVAAGATQSFAGYFIMPSSNVKIHAISYYYSSDGSWYLEDELTKNVSITYTWVLLGSVTTLSLTPGQAPEEGWVLLGSVTSLSLTPQAPEGEWVLLGSVTSLSLTPGQAPGEWYELGQLSDFLLTPGAGVEPPTECSIDSDCPEGYICIDGICVLKEEGKEFPWLPVALGVGALIVGAVALTSKKKPKGKTKAKVS